MARVIPSMLFYNDMKSEEQYKNLKVQKKKKAISERWRELRSSTAPADIELVNKYKELAKQARVEAKRPKPAKIAKFNAYCRYAAKFRPFVQELYPEMSNNEVTNTLMRNWLYLPRMERYYFRAEDDVEEAVNSNP